MKKNIKEKTTDSFICVSDLRYHAKANVRKIKGTDTAKNFSMYLNLTDETLCFGEHYICNACFRTITTKDKDGQYKIPQCNEYEHEFLLPEMPAEFQTEEMKLNKCEQNLLNSLYYLQMMEKLKKFALFSLPKKKCFRGNFHKGCSPHPHLFVKKD